MQAVEITKLICDTAEFITLIISIVYFGGLAVKEAARAITCKHKADKEQ